MSLARSFLWLTIAEIFFNLSGYIVHSGAGRLLSPSDYGRYGLIITLTVMIINLVANGIPISMSKYLSEHYDSNNGMVRIIRRRALVLQIAIITGITAIFYAFTPLLSALLGDPTLTPLFRISLFILPAYALDTYYFYYFTGIHQFNLQSGLKVVRSLLRITLILGLIVVWKLNGAIAGYIFVNLAGFLIALAIDRFWLAKKFASGPSAKPSAFPWGKLLNYAWPITLFIIFYEILISLDIYFIKALLGNDHETGIYNSALTIARIPYYLFTALNVILLPSISKSLAQNDHEKARELVSQSLRLLILVLLPIATLIAVFAGPTITFVFGAKYLGGAVSLQILVFGISFLTVFYVLSFTLNGAGKVKVPMYMAFFGMLLNAALNYAFIKHCGITGSAIATTTTALVIMIISLSYCTGFFGTLLNSSRVLKSILAALIMGGVALLFPQSNGLFLFFSLLLTTLYIGILFVLKEITSEDIALIKNLLQRKKLSPKEQLPIAE